MNNPTEIEQLKKVLFKINDNEYNESAFDVLYELLKNEHARTNESDTTGYKSNLRQTINKQAKSYIAMRRKRPVKGSPSDYSSFISNFRQDVTEALYRLEYKTNSQNDEDEV